MKNIVVYGCAFLVAMAVVTGCSGAEDAGNTASGTEPEVGTTSNRLLAQVTMPNGNVISFEEVESGLVFVAERGRVENALTVTDEMAKLGNVALYERLANEPAPAALVESQVREAELVRAKAAAPHKIREAAENSAPELASRDESAGRDGVATTSQALSSGLNHDQFVAAFCGTSWSSLCNWVGPVTGHGQCTFEDREKFVSSAISYAGTISYTVKVRPWASWRDLRSSEPIPAGYYDHVVNYNSNIDFDTKVIVDGPGTVFEQCAQGDRY